MLPFSKANLIHYLASIVSWRVRLKKVHTALFKQPQTFLPVLGYFGVWRF